VNRKTLLLNALLAGLMIWAGVQWRSQYLAAQARERKMRTAKATQKTPSPLPALPAQPPVQAAGYNNVAQKLLLHPSRNPDEPVEEAPPPPPPPPMPPLPKYHGSMNLDGVATAILSVGQDRFREIKPGESIGQFKLVDVNTRDITFEWNNQQVRKTLDELLDRKIVDNSPGPQDSGQLDQRVRGPRCASRSATARHQKPDRAGGRNRRVRQEAVRSQ
jgi:hypothetical protein